MSQQNRSANTMQHSTILAGSDLVHAGLHPPVPFDCIWPGFVAGTVGVLYGPGGTGKSMLAVELAIAVAIGVDVAGITGACATGPVVYLTAEDPEQAIRHRLYALSRHHVSASDWERVKHALLFKFVGGEVPDLMRDTTYLQEAAQGARLLILDTMRRFHDGDENDSRAMKLLLAKIEAVAHQTGCAILIIHHASKVATLNHHVANQGAAKGSSVIIDHARFAAALSEVPKRDAATSKNDADNQTSCARYTITKINYAPNPGPTVLRRTAEGVLVLDGRTPHRSTQVNGHRRSRPTPCY